MSKSPHKDWRQYWFWNAKNTLDNLKPGDLVNVYSGSGIVTGVVVNKGFSSHPVLRVEIIINRYDGSWTSSRTSFWGSNLPIRVVKADVLSIQDDAKQLVQDLMKRYSQ